MTRYRVAKEETFDLKEGDAPQPIEFNMPDVFDMSLYNIEVKAYTSSRRTIFHKKSVDGEITIDGQLISVLFTPDDLKGFAGKHRWEGQIVKKADANFVVTFGKGPLIIYNDYLR